MSAALRLTVVLDAGQAPRWQLMLLADLSGAETCEVLARTVPAVRPPRGNALFRLYERLDRQRFGDSEGILTLDQHGHGPLGEQPPDADAVLWLADAEPPDELVRAGVSLWLIRQGVARAGAEAPLLDEVRAGRGLVATTLCERTIEGERVLHRAVGSADQVSLERSRVRAAAKASRLPLRYLRYRERGRDTPEPVSPIPPVRSPPGAARTLAFLAPLAVRLGARRLRSAFFEQQWLLAYRSLDRPNRTLTDSSRFTVLRPPPGHFWADPFLLPDPDGDLLFLEDFDYELGRGILSYTRLDGATPAAPRVAVQMDTHLSYPFVFGDGNRTLMIPETRTRRHVELLETADPTGPWEHSRVLIDHLALTDSTLLRHEGRLWLFGTVSPDGGPAVDELHAFWADSLEGEWTPHPLNPLVCDVRRARPAGSFIRRDGRLLRPSQDCSSGYGVKMVLNRVEVLTPDDYLEVAAGELRIEGRGRPRTHTYNATERWEVIDCMRLTPRWARLRRPRTGVTLRVDLPAGAGPVP